MQPSSGRKLRRYGESSWRSFFLCANAIRYDWHVINLPAASLSAAACARLEKDEIPSRFVPTGAMNLAHIHVDVVKRTATAAKQKPGKWGYHVANLTDYAQHRFGVLR
jgi:hypothetical protein